MLQFMKNARLYIVSIHRNFYQNQFINECARKKKAKILESQKCNFFDKSTTSLIKIQLL